MRKSEFLEGKRFSFFRTGSIGNAAHLSLRYITHFKPHLENTINNRWVCEVIEVKPKYIIVESRGFYCVVREKIFLSAFKLEE